MVAPKNQCLYAPLGGDPATQGGVDTVDWVLKNLSSACVTATERERERGGVCRGPRRRPVGVQGVLQPQGGGPKVTYHRSWLSTGRLTKCVTSFHCGFVVICLKTAPPARRRRPPLVAPRWRLVAFIVRGRRACMMINGATGRTSPPAVTRGGTYKDNQAVFVPTPPPPPPSQGQQTARFKIS